MFLTIDNHYRWRKSVSAWMLIAKRVSQYIYICVALWTSSKKWKRRDANSGQREIKTEPRPRQSAKAATGARVGCDWCTNSIVQRDTQTGVSFSTIFEPLVWSNGWSTLRRSFYSTRSTVPRTRCTRTLIQRASSLTVILNDMQITTDVIVEPDFPFSLSCYDSWMSLSLI